MPTAQQDAPPRQEPDAEAEAAEARRRELAARQRELVKRSLVACPTSGGGRSS
jgi:hypothetical protein